LRAARRLTPGVPAAVFLAFAAGWTSAGTLFATRINSGLVNAFSSVGQNLFGEAAFGAVTVPPNPILPQGAVQIDVALDTKIPTLVGVFSPLDPCRRFAQLEVQGDTLIMAVDFDAVPDGINTQIVPKSLADIPPAVDRCLAPPTVDTGR
jgi:hypothetical protein